ncbi:EAL domain-containing protein [Halalkalibacter kiskunsagensis]|uniref:histidine kinase n=1 Tax=Halalkalibacter kiskunsagensis TaxID=1548599 RepID=A0ABV6KHM4_9BACI
MITSILSNYNPILFAASTSIAILASYTGIDILSRLPMEKGKRRAFWLCSGTIVVGVGIYTAHFLSMMMFEFNHFYHISDLLLTLLISVGMTSIPMVLCLKAIQSQSHKDILIGGLTLGLSFVVIHYVAMHVSHEHIGYQPLSIVLSVFAAMIPAYFIFKKVVFIVSYNGNPSLYTQMIFGGLMGISIMAMHYLSLVGTTIINHEYIGHEEVLENNYSLSIFLGIGIMLTFFIFILSSRLDRKISIQSEKLSQSEQDYYSLFEQNPDIVAKLSLDGTILSANKAMEKITGYHKMEWKNHPVSMFIDHDFLEVTNEKFTEATKGRATHYESRLALKNGEVANVYMTNLPIINNGNIVGVYVIIKDITDKKKLLEQIEINEQRYKSLFDYNNDAVFSFDLLGHFTSVNKAVEQISGYPPSELMKKPFVDYIHPEDLSEALEAFAVSKQGKSQTLNCRIIHKDGGTIFCNVTSTPIIVNNDIVGVYGIAKDITKQKKTEEMIEHMAYHDYLTGLPNRNMLEKCLTEKLTVAESENQKVAILFIDLDRFKNINDTLGHSMGDLLLKEISKRLQETVNDQDLVFRQGGDEFIVLLHNANRSVASKMTKQILDVIATPIHINSYEIFTSPSIGIALYPDDGDHAETLIKNADFAMYQAKHDGKNTYHFYSNKKAGDFNPLVLEMELHRAIERNELVLYYQPKVNLKTGRVIGTEALLRWNHPTWGIVSPADFIPLAEETGLITPIGEWVLHTACTQMKKWNDQRAQALTISVNLSTKQFSQTKLVATVAKILKQSGLDPKCLELEITESMTADIDKTISTLLELKRLGVRISIDDFGTGFSSLNYLNQFPVDALKINESFVRELNQNPSNETIVQTIISLAHSLQLNVVAEGIETREQLVFLQQHLCDDGQGFFFSRPLSALEFNRNIDKVDSIVKEFGISTFVNERMWMEETLRIARKELQETVRRQQGMIFKVKKINNEFIHTLCDGELLYECGFIPEQIVGKTLFDFLPEKWAKNFTNAYVMAWRGEEHVTFEGQVKGNYYLIALNPIKRGGEVVEIVGSGINITKLKETEKALRESREKFKLIAENMSDLIAIFDLDGKITYASPSHETVLASSVSYFEGRNPINHIHRDDQPEYNEVFAETIKTKRSTQMELRWRKSDGTWLLLEALFTPVINENGQVGQVVGVARDITEKRKAEELLAKSEKLSIVGELAAGVAHEIRNPLTSIKGFVQLFKQGMMDEKYFPIIFDEFNRIEEIINEFLNLAKPQKMKLQRTNPVDLLNGIETLLAPEAHLKNVEILKEFEQHLPEILCDPNQLKQVFINLLKNSIDAMPNGGTLVLKTSLEEDNLLIRVLDTGMGISEERLEKLGEPFFSNKEKGTGLGLMLCYRIIHEHNGTITIKSKENVGTTVEVRVPVRVPGTSRKLSNEKGVG